MDSITAVPIGRRDRRVPRPVGKAAAAAAAGETLSKFGLINFAREKRGVATAAAKTSGAEGGGTVQLTGAAAAIASHRGRREMFYEQATSSLRGAKQCGCAVRRSGPSPLPPPSPPIWTPPSCRVAHGSAGDCVHPSIPIPLSIEFSKDESLCPSTPFLSRSLSWVSNYISGERG